MNSIYVTKEEQKILQEYIEKIYMGQQQAMENIIYIPKIIKRNC